MRGNLGDTHGVPSPGGRGTDGVPFPIHDALADFPFARADGRDVRALPAGSLPGGAAAPAGARGHGAPAAHASHAPHASVPSPVAASASDPTFYFVDSVRLASGHVTPATPHPHGPGAAAPPADHGRRPAFDVHAVRRDFPILQERVNGCQLVWFDNAATRTSRSR